MGAKDKYHVEIKSFISTSFMKNTVVKSNQLALLVINTKKEEIVKWIE